MLWVRMYITYSYNTIAANLLIHITLNFRNIELAQ